MSEAWIGLIGVVVGVLITSLAEAVRSRVQFTREKHWEYFEDRRARLEEIYRLVDEHRETYNRLFADGLRMLDPSDKGEREPLSPIPWARLRMLIGLYVPELKPAFEDVMQFAPKAGEILGNITLNPPQTAADRQYISDQLVLRFDSLFQAYQRFNEEVEELSDRLRAEMYARPKRKHMRLA